LDDISPLREITASVASESAHLFKPGDAIRVRRNVNGDTPFPPEIPHAVNAPVGALIYYYLGAAPTGDITLDITDSAGKLVRHMSSAPVPPLAEPPPPVPDFWVEKPKPMPTELGTNRVSWNLRYDNPPAFSHSYEINANPGETPASPEGPLVLPGVYTVTLTVNGKAYKQTVTVKNDPRSPATAADLKAQHELQMKLYEGMKAAWDGYHEVTSMRAAVAEITKANPAEEVSKAAEDFDGKLVAVGGSSGGGRRFGGGFGGPAASPTFSGVLGGLNRQLQQLDSGDMAPNEALSKAGSAAYAELAKAQQRWKALNEKDLVAFNAVLTKYSLKPIAAGQTR
jgi:hypothetical protein